MCLALAGVWPVCLAAGTMIQATICQAGPPPSANITTPADGTQTTDPSIIVGGNASADSTVHIDRNGSEVASVVAASDGSYQVSVPLVVGDNHLTAKASTACAVSPVSPIVTVTRLQAIPMAPVIASPADNTTTTAVNIKVSGSAEPGSTVHLYHNDLLIATVPATADGLFSVTAGLTAGVNDFKATAANSTGTSPFSATVRVLQIISLPLPPLTQPSPPGSVTLISPAGDSTTDASTTTVHGAAPPGATVTIFNNEQARATVIAGVDGLFGVTIDLLVGPNRIRAQIQSPGGEISASPTVTITRVLKPPLPPRIVKPAEGAVFHTPVIEVTGMAEPGTTILLSNNGRRFATVQVGADGTFATQITLTPGNNVIVVTVHSGGGESSDTVHVTYWPAGKGGIQSYLKVAAGITAGVTITGSAVFWAAAHWQWPRGKLRSGK